MPSNEDEKEIRGLELRGSLEIRRKLVITNQELRLQEDYVENLR